MAALTSFPSPSRRRYSDSDREQNRAFFSSFYLSFGGGDSIFKVHRETVPSIGSQREALFFNPLTNQLGKFLRFWQSNLKSPLNFSKGPFYLLWIRGTIWQGVFEKFLNFSIKTQKSRPPDDGRTADNHYWLIDGALFLHTLLNNWSYVKI